MGDRQSAGTIQFATATASVVEGGTARVTVTRSGANLVGDVTVGWSATGSAADFSPASGTLTFGPGVTGQTFDITTTDDTLADGPQTIVLSLAPPTGGAALGTPSSMTLFVIDAEETVALATPTATVGETALSATLQIVRSGVPTGIVTVQAQTVDGTAVANRDYVANSQTITFQAGEIAKPFVVALTSPTLANRSTNRTLTVALRFRSACTPATRNIERRNAESPNRFMRHLNRREESRSATGSRTTS